VSGNSGIRNYIDVGTNTFSGNLRRLPNVQPIRIDGSPVISARLEDGHYMLSLNIADTFGRTVLRIINNELVFSTLVWDAALVGRRLILRDALRRILVDIEFSPPCGVKIRRGRFVRNGVEVLVTDRFSAILNDRTLVRDNSMANCWIGLSLGRDSNHIPVAYWNKVENRDNWDRSAAISWANAEAKNLGEEQLGNLFGVGDAENSK
jgi:trigger factor